MNKISKKCCIYCGCKKVIRWGMRNNKQRYFCLESQFSYLKNNLKIHRGLSKESRENFIRWYYYFKKQK